MLKFLVISFVVLQTVNLADVSYYEILQVSKQASTQEVKQAFKKLAIKYHPDKNSANSDKFLKIKEAYETLKHSETRRQYDLNGSYQSYTRKYYYQSNSEYNDLLYSGLYHNDPHVDTVTGDGYDNYLTEGFYFINFYSPFCPPCQRLSSSWKKLAEIYKGIISIAAVNCKYHQSFCYNDMGISSYPTLIFYPNGKDPSNYIYYHGELTLEGLEEFIQKYLGFENNVPTINELENTDKPMVYLIGLNRVERHIVTRIAYNLRGLVNIVTIEDDNIRAKLTRNDDTVAVFKHKDITKEIDSADEKDILREIVNALPDVEPVDPDKFKDIRNKLRNGYETPCALHFTNDGQIKLQLHQMKHFFPDMHFGEIDCDKWGHLCMSLQVEETPAWGVLKPGGGYQLASSNSDVRTFLQTAVKATRLHTISTSEYLRVLNGDAGIWFLLVVPHQVSWDHAAEPFTLTSLQFIDNENIHFGIMTCNQNNDNYCRQVADEKPTIMMINGTRRHFYKRSMDKKEMLDYIDMLINESDLELTEQQVLEILDYSSRKNDWLVAYLPAHCERFCDELLHEWRIVAKKLRPLKNLRVGLLQCVDESGFCSNVRTPTARLYPAEFNQHYTLSLLHLSQAPYIWEWTLEYLDDSVEKINWQIYSKQVISDKLYPSESKPWLIYFHSPKCYTCYENYADFFIAGYLLGKAVQLGKVNCLEDRLVCQQAHIESYPTLRLYINRSQQGYSSFVTIHLREYDSMLYEIRSYLKNYDVRDDIDLGVRGHGFAVPIDLGVKHEEL